MADSPLSRLMRPEVAWPMAVVGLLSLGIGSAFAVLYFAGSDGGPQVIENYYRLGVATDSLAAERNAFRDLGWTLSIDVAGPGGRNEPRRVELRVTDRAGAGVPALDMEVDALRPQRVDPVSRQAAAEIAPGRYVVAVPIDEGGLWDFRVTGRHDGRAFSETVRTEVLR